MKLTKTFNTLDGDTGYDVENQTTLLHVLNPQAMTWCDPSCESFLKKSKHSGLPRCCVQSVYMSRTVYTSPEPRDSSKVTTCIFIFKIKSLQQRKKANSGLVISFILERYEYKEQKRHIFAIYKIFIVNLRSFQAIC